MANEIPKFMIKLEQIIIDTTQKVCNIRRYMTARPTPERSLLITLLEKHNPSDKALKLGLSIDHARFAKIISDMDMYFQGEIGLKYALNDADKNLYSIAFNTKWSTLSQLLANYTQNIDMSEVQFDEYISKLEKYQQANAAINRLCIIELLLPFDPNIQQFVTDIEKSLEFKEEEYIGDNEIIVNEQKMDTPTQITNSVNTTKFEPPSKSEPVISDSFKTRNSILISQLIANTNAIKQTILTIIERYSDDLLLLEQKIETKTGMENSELSWFINPSNNNLIKSIESSYASYQTLDKSNFDEKEKEIFQHLHYFIMQWRTIQKNVDVIMKLNKPFIYERIQRELKVDIGKHNSLAFEGYVGDSKLNFQDLVQECNIRFYNSLFKLSTKGKNKDNSLTTYFYWELKSIIHTTIQKYSGLVYLPNDVFNVLNIIKRSEIKTMKKYPDLTRNTTVYNERLLEIFNEITPSSIPPLTLKKLEKFLEIKFQFDKILNLDSERSNPNSDAHYDMPYKETYPLVVVIDETVNLDDEVVLRDLLVQIHNVLETLSSTETKLILQRFGFDGNGEQTLGDIANEHGVSRERIRQIENKGFRKLRNPDRNKGLRDFLN